MKIQPYIQKLHSSPTYREFQEQYKDAFLVAGFFVIDYEEGRNVHQIDYYVPSKKKVAAFTLDKNVLVQMLNLMDKRVPEKLDLKTHIDLEALNGIIQDEMKNRNITQSIKKMIAVVQNQKGKAIWNVNCILSGMDLLKVHVEDETQSVLRMEKSSLMDYVKRLPTPGEQATGEKKSGSGVTKQAIEEKIAQLDKMKELLQKEEVQLDKQEPSQAPEAEKKEQAPVKKRKK